MDEGPGADIHIEVGVFLQESQFSRPAEGIFPALHIERSNNAFSLGLGKQFRDIKMRSSSVPNSGQGLIAIDLAVLPGEYGLEPGGKVIGIEKMEQQLPRYRCLYIFFKQG